MRLLVTISLLSACGATPTGEAPIGPPAGMTAPRASASDEIVATVNGKPVWGSCVAIQAQRGAATKRAALEQCIELELLAQTADQRGYASAPEVREATHTAMVSELVATAYEDGFTQPAQFGAVWNQAVTKGQWKIAHENYRASAYVRVPVPDGAAPADVGAAKIKAEKIAAALASETGLMGPSLVELAEKAAGTKLDHQDVPAYRAGALDPAYAKALFAMPEIGRASAAVRTKWGWDVIVWTDDVPATKPTQAEIDAKLLPDVKLAYFDHWVDLIAKSLGVHVELDQKNVAKLEDLP